jgi:hypothetical protein
MTDEQRGQNTGGDAGNQLAPEQQNVALSINALHRTYQAANNQDTQQQDKQLYWTRVSAIAACFYTVFTLVLIGASIYTVCVALRATNIADRTLIASSRSWVIPDSADLNNFDYISGDPSIQPHTTAKLAVHIKNWGKSPARGQIVARIDRTIASVPDWSGACASGGSAGIAEPFAVNPTGDATVTLEASGYSDISQLTNGGFYIIGCIEYFDIIGKEPPMLFCLEPRNKAPDGTAIISSGARTIPDSLRLCERYPWKEQGE